MINIGDRVQVIKRRLGHNACVGLKGIVYNIDESIYTDEEKRNGKGFRKIEIYATNWGHPMKSSLGIEKRVFAWKPDDKCTMFEEEIILIDN